MPLTATLLHVPAADGAEQSAAVLAMTPGLLHHLLDKGYSRRLTLLLLLRGVCVCCQVQQLLSAMAL